MREIYCSDCGKRLKLVNTQNITKYNTNTGKPYIITYYTYVCNDYEEGFSDREWHVHDKIIIPESTEEMK